MRIAFTWLAIGAAVLGWAVPTSAGIIETTMNTGSGFRGPVNILYDGNLRVEYAGNIGYLGGSTVGSESVPFFYCVDIFKNIYVPGQYNAQVSDDGTIYNGNLLANAGHIAWLLVNRGSAADTAEEQMGLQAAIWKQVYGSHFELSGDNLAGVIAAYNTYLTDMGSQTESLSRVLWVSPYSGNYDWVQAQVTLDPTPAPEPASLIVWGLVTVGIAGRSWRKRQDPTASLSPRVAV